MKLLKNRKGLTLIELLIVVIILGALVAIAIPRMSQNAVDAKERACATNRATINTQVELYYSEYGSWPTMPGFLSEPNFFPEEPNCPVTGGSYDYYGTEYRITCSKHGH
jgi:prepilin-type N-terminal cleavage/methylation domain-containing protein